MQRISIAPRINWQSRVEELGFSFHHTQEGLYWDESAYYQFNAKQIAVLEKATHSLHQMCLRAVKHVIDNRLYPKLGIPEIWVPFIEKSWYQDHPSIYGRFDLQYDGIHPPKMLEYNADTPTSLFEASIVQWFWLQDIGKNKDQFNSIHEKLVERFGHLKRYYHDSALHFSCARGSAEDLTTTAYMMDCAIQAGLQTAFIYTDDIGYYTEKQIFTDLNEKSIRNIFKLYPWEWMIHESFGEKLLETKEKIFWTEPPWKMILSNKGILPILWQLYPNHKNLLPAWFEEDFVPDVHTTYVKKPKLSREGANIEISGQGLSISGQDQGYGEEGYIFQKFCPLPEFEGNFPVIGSWIIGQQAAGIGIRESNNLITDNFSRFVPHCF